ncbi:MAG: TlpA family protein disulfide reductase [Acidimicrobiia bacterium]|nr:TlpA family protein disulfide reductase [Acidimicrobiia bacterium]
MNAHRSPAPGRTLWRALRRLTMLGVVPIAMLASCTVATDDPAAIPVRPLAGGETIPLGSLVDGPTVVNVWASWCAPCRTEMPALEEVHVAMGDRVTIIGITDDPDPEAAEALARELGVTYPLYMVDNPGDLRQLGVLGLPATVFVDESVTIITTHAGVLDAAGITDEIRSAHGID